MNPTSIGYAFALGLVGVLNPCGFPLLPAYMALFVTSHRDDWRERLLRGVRAGACMSTGFLLVFVLIGILAASAVSAIIAWVPLLMIVIGVGLLVVGVLAVAGRTVALRLPALGFRAGRGPFAMLGFGASYALASLSCSLPLFLAGVIGAFTNGSFADGLSAFVAYALGMGLFVTAVSIVTSLTGGTAIRGLRPLVRVLPRLAGVVLVIAASYLIFYWIHQLVNLHAPSDLITAAQRVQNTVSAWISAAWLPLGAGLGCLVVGSLIVLALISAHKEAGSPDA